MKYLLLIATSVFVLSFGVVYAASPSAQAPLTVTVTPSGGGGNPGPLPGSILPSCPGGCTWSVAFDDEFNGNGSPGNLAADGINWNVWSEPYAEGSTAYSYTSTAGAVITDCTDAAFESGGYLHILPVGSVAVGQGTSSNPAKGCEIDLAGATPGYWEAYVNYDNALGWADADWFCCSGNNGDTGFEIDVFELDGPVQLATVFWNSYASSQRLYTAASYLAGWHEIGVDWEAKSGYSVYIDGTNRGSANPDGCSASTPCNNPTNLRIINALTQPAFMPNSTGMLVDWIRHYTHP